LPTYFISHGGGPWPWIKDLMPIDFAPLETSLQQMSVELRPTPRAILCISGHWEEPTFTVMASADPPMIYDYGGFPEFTYHLRYPAPGSPEVARRIVDLLDGSGMDPKLDDARGFDHGTFAPFYVMYPDATVPILQLSLRADYDPAAHLAVGRALTPLRDEGVAIIGSGLSYHNLGALGPQGADPSRRFDAWLTETLCSLPPGERAERLTRWDEAPAARFCHPKEDHLIPLMVAVGAAEEELGTRTYHEDTMAGSITVSSYRFGSVPA
jgi:aromatic ring-opening dioxygenase catalytic subunit (LigB family)